MSKKALIKSVGDSFRRCGITFNREGVVVDVETLKQEQIEQLSKEPQLRIEQYVDPEVESDSSENDGKAAKASKAK